MSALCINRKGVLGPSKASLSKPNKNKARPKLFIPEVGGPPPMGKIPVGLPRVNEKGVARLPFEKEGRPVRNFFASILYGMGIVLRSGR